MVRNGSEEENDDAVLLLAREKKIRLLSSPENSHVSSHTSCSSINRLDLIAGLI
jgi:hypothetical protein